MKKIKYLILAALAVINFISCAHHAYSGGTSDIDGSIQDFSSYANGPVLLSPIKNQIYFGAFPDFGGREDLVSNNRIRDFERLAGKKIAWAYFSNNWFNGIKFPQKAVSEIHAANMVPFIRLMPRSDDENYHKEKLYTMQNIIDGRFDASLREWARDSKKTNIPLLVDFAIEMNGDWFSWSGYYNGGQTKDKYEWLDDAFSTILSNPFINFTAISYWHENWEEKDDLFAFLRIDSSDESLKTFRDWVNNDMFVSDLIFNNQNSELLFKSGFEEGVFIENPVADEGGIWWQQIQGSDIEGFSWPMDILGLKGELQLIVDSTKNINSYVENKIETGIGADGDETQALHQIIKKKQYEYTQDPYIIYTDGTEIEDLYIKYSLKFPENMSELLGADGWAVISEFKTTGDYRLAFYVYLEDNNLYWYVHGDNVVIDGAPYKEFWYRENRSVPVPVGTWFDMEIYWHRSQKSDGRVLWAIDSAIITGKPK